MFLQKKKKKESSKNEQKIFNSYFCYDHETIGHITNLGRLT